MLHCTEKNPPFCSAGNLLLRQVLLCADESRSRGSRPLLKVLYCTEKNPPFRSAGNLLLRQVLRCADESRSRGSR